MECPKCGYMMQRSDKDCPRCVPAFVITPTIAPPPQRPQAANPLPPPSHPSVANPIPPKPPISTPLPPRAPLKMEQPREPITPIQLFVGILLAVGMFLLLLQFRGWRQDGRNQRNAKMYEPFSGGPPSMPGQSSNQGVFPGQQNVRVQPGGPQNNPALENLQKMQQQTHDMQTRNLEQMRQQQNDAQTRLNEMQRQNTERMQNMGNRMGGPRGMGPGATGPGAQFGGGGFGGR